MAALSFTFPKSPIDLGDRVHALPADGSVPGMPGWRWIPTPGHAPGHVSFVRDSDRTVIAGDAFTTTKQESLLAALTQRPEMHGPPMYFTPDWDASRRSVQHLADYSPTAAITGHGPPMRGSRLQEQLHQLAQHFDERARPAHGRYRDRAAITNRDGVVDVPPPVVSARTLAIAGVALGALGALGAVVALAVSRRRHASTALVRADAPRSDPTREMRWGTSRCAKGGGSRSRTAATTSRSTAPCLPAFPDSPRRAGFPCTLLISTSHQGPSWHH